MSTIVAQTLSNGTVSTSTANCIQGSAKAWVNFVGSNGTRNASYNVSSVTRHSTGNYTVTFTNALPDANYAVTGCVNRNNGAADAGGVGYFSQATGSTEVYTYAPQFSFNDATSVSIAVFD